MNIKLKARDNKISSQALRVFLSLDPQNISDRNELIISDLLSMDAGAGFDCVVLYHEIPEQDIDTTLLRNELQNIAVVVLWVTEELLQMMYAGKLPEEYKLAMELQRPILPIAKYATLLSEFTRAAKAGVHGIAKDDPEYRTKLKSQLDKIFISKANVKLVQSIFPARIFLSYRKTDIEKAREFMKIFHNIEGFEAISIWYDNFLSAGRLYDDEIFEAIDKCDVFVLFATKNIYAKNYEGKANYVVSTEYPYAKKKGKPIIAVDVGDSDRKKLSKVFRKVDIISVDDRETLASVFNELLKHTELAKFNKFNMNADDLSLGYNLFLLSTAYSFGVGVERDAKKAIELVGKATRGAADILMENMPPDHIALANLGVATTWSEASQYDTALEFCQKALDACVKAWGSEHLEHLISIKVYVKIGEMYNKKRNYPESLKWLNKALEALEKRDKSDREGIGCVYFYIGIAHGQRGDNQTAISFFQKAYETLPQNGNERSICANDAYVRIGMCYHTMAIMQKMALDFQGALELLYKTYIIFEQIAATGGQGEEVMLARENIIVVRDQISALYKMNIDKTVDKDNDSEALKKLLFDDLEIRKRIFGDTHFMIADSCYNIGIAYERQNDFTRAWEWYFKSYAICHDILGENDPLTEFINNALIRVFLKRDAES